MFNIICLNEEHVATATPNVRPQKLSVFIVDYMQPVDLFDNNKHQVNFRLTCCRWKCDLVNLFQWFVEFIHFVVSVVQLINILLSSPPSASLTCSQLGRLVPVSLPRLHRTSFLTASADLSAVFTISLCPRCVSLSAPGFSVCFVTMLVFV